MNNQRRFQPINFARATLPFLAATATFAPTLARAQHPHGPPPEAYAACDSKAAGDACTMSMHGETVDGTCNMFPSDTRLSCRPNHPPPVPRAALEACRDKKEGDACTVTFDGHTMDGTCENGRGEGLSCRPSGPPPR
ncbi:MAG: hypothetical protein ABTD50_04080 [Polyangiaceae bacterium]|jgi:hypothetical protein